MPDLILAIIRAAPRPARMVRLGALRWHVRDAARSAVWRLWSEPLPGFVGWAFLLAGGVMWALASGVLKPGLLSGLCVTEAEFLTAAGTGLVIVSELIKFFRGRLTARRKTWRPS